MKKLLVFMFCILIGCKEENVARFVGNSNQVATLSNDRYTITLQCNQKLVNTTQDHYAGVGFLTRNMRPEEFPETYVFVASINNESYGTYSFVESRCQPQHQNVNCVNQN